MISDKGKSELQKSINRFGDISGIIHDIDTDEILCGNQRMKAIGFSDNDIKITEQFDKPLEDGTVAIGFIEKDGVLLNYRQVKLTEKERELVSLSANKMGGEFDYDKFDLFDKAILEECGFSTVDKFDRAIENQRKAESRKLITVGVFSFNIDIQTYEKYCVYLKTTGEGSIIDLFLTDIGL